MDEEDFQSLQTSKKKQTSTKPRPCQNRGINVVESMEYLTPLETVYSIAPMPCRRASIVENGAARRVIWTLLARGAASASTYSYVCCRPRAGT